MRKTYLLEGIAFLALFTLALLADGITAMLAAALL